MNENIKLICAEGEWININFIKKIYVYAYECIPIDSKRWHVEILDFDNQIYICTEPLLKDEAHKRLGEIAKGINRGIDVFDYF